MVEGGHVLALFKSLFGASNGFWPSMGRLHTTRWPADCAEKRLLVSIQRQKNTIFRNFPCTASICRLCWCSVKQRTRAVCVSIDLVIICWGLTVFVVIGLPSNVTDFNSDKKRGKMMWCCHFDTDYWKYPKHGTSSRTFTNKYRRVLSFCGYLPKSVFLQPHLFSYRK